MYKRKKTWNRLLSVMVGLMTICLTVLLPAVSFASDGGGTYSGDDAYDPAAGGTPEESVSAIFKDNAAPLDCGLSAGEISRRIALRVPGGCSGDDPYDPAAGGIPELSLLPFAKDPGLMAACVPAVYGN